MTAMGVTWKTERETKMVLVAKLAQALPPQCTCTRTPHRWDEKIITTTLVEMEDQKEWLLDTYVISRKKNHAKNHATCYNACKNEYRISSQHSSFQPVQQHPLSESILLLLDWEDPKKLKVSL
jgi:hypothetical protein